MKPRTTLHPLGRRQSVLGSVLLGCLLASPTPQVVHAGDPTEHSPRIIAVEDIEASARATDLTAFERLADQFKGERKGLIAKLQDILKDPRSSFLNRYAAAYYLGELRASEAAPALAAHIELDLQPWPFIIRHFPIFGKSPVLDALVKIGCAAIPAVLRNLADSDNPVVRHRSLEVLRAVEGDIEVCRLRLRRAIEAEQDPAKKARLRAATDELSKLGNR